jgi:glutamate synthase (NADPH) small chain
MVGAMPKGSKVTNWAKETISAEQLQGQDFDAVLLTGGSEQSRDLPVPGRDLDGVHFAMEFLPQQNKVNAGDKLKGQLRADGKHVIVIGGGDTGSDCVGTSNRHGALSVTQFEVMPQPPEEENKPLVWPYWPLKLRTSSSHEEGCTREFAMSTKAFKGEKGKVTGLRPCTSNEGRQAGGDSRHRKGIQGRPRAAGHGICQSRWPPCSTLSASTKTPAATPRHHRLHRRLRHQRAQGVRRWRHAPWPVLVVWAIREGRQAARAVDEFLMGFSDLPR